MVQVEGLRPGKSYLFRVRASNAKGQGPWSSTSGAETQPAPPEPPGAPVISQRASTSARCKWDVPVEDHGAAVLRYRHARWHVQGHALVAIGVTKNHTRMQSHDDVCLQRWQFTQKHPSTCLGCGWPCHGSLMVKGCNAGGA